MNLEKVVFGFFTIFACTLNFGFFLGDMDRPDMHHPSELFAAIIVNLIALVIKFGDRTQLGATHLATSLVATLQLLAAAMVWLWTVQLQGQGMDSEVDVDHRLDVRRRTARQPGLGRAAHRRDAAPGPLTAAAGIVRERAWRARSVSDVA